MYVELFGLPGSGKTTLANTLKTMEGVEGVGVTPSYRDTARFLLYHPLASLWWMYTVVKETARSKTWGLFRFKLSMVALAFARVMKAECSRAPIVLLDEGLTQRVITVFEHRIRDDEALPVVKRLLFKTAIVCVEPKGPFHDRLSARNNARAELGNEYLKNWERIAVHNYGVIVRTLKRASIPYCVYAAGDDPKAVYDALMKKGKGKK